MQKLDNLIEQYQKRVLTLKSMKGLDMIAETRLKTKASYYRTFIVELERLKTQLNEESK